MFNPLGPDRVLIWDIIAAIISLTVVMAVVQINGYIQKKGLLPTVITRKVVHLLVAPIFMATWPLYSGAWTSRYIAMLVPMLFVAMFTAIGKGIIEDEAFVRSMSRSGDPAELLKGTLYYAVIVVLATILWFYIPVTGLADANPTAFIVFGCLAGGDGLADIIGRQYGGKVKFGFFGSKKTLMGSIGMFVGSFLFSLILVSMFSLETAAISASGLLVSIMVFSLIATIVEAVSPPSLDNITIVVSVLVVMMIFNAVAPGLWGYALTTI
ncbi:MAG: phosphatidate cytidylyltransferase [Candidatus Bathyarchaeota archaeon]|nr:phosphatidate cytidylyltransferase [Candidatus Bathyarchaeota archaeon]